MRSVSWLAALAAALGAGGCGPYAELAQKLDVGSVIAGGETWISTSGTEVRVLLLGPPGPAGEPAAFAFTAMSLPIAAGTAVRSAQGEWGGDPAAADLALHERLLYRLDDERGTPLLERHGATREDMSRTVTLGQTRAGGRLVLTGDATVAGTYVLLRAALAGRGGASADDAACAFSLANLAVLSSQVRIVGFGSAGMTQYKTAATFQGTTAGSVRVAVRGTLSVTTDIDYAQFADFGGVTIDGTQTTHVNSGGDGYMSGVLTLSLRPETLPAVDGSISYGPGGDSGDAIRISNGFASGGRYLVTLVGGGTSKVDPMAAPSPSVAECLGLSPP